MRQCASTKGFQKVLVIARVLGRRLAVSAEGKKGSQILKGPEKGVLTRGL